MPWIKAFCYTPSKCPRTPLEQFPGKPPGVSARHSMPCTPPQQSQPPPPQHHHLHLHPFETTAPKFSAPLEPIDRLQHSACAGAHNNHVFLLQVNYLGPYHLTRLLEPQLATSAPSRVVNVSSIMHRSGHVDSDPKSFLKDWNKGSQYSNTKLGNVLFTYEAQRRLGPKGIQVRHTKRLLHLMCRHVIVQHVTST